MFEIPVINQRNFSSKKTFVWVSDTWCEIKTKEEEIKTAG